MIKPICILCKGSRDLCRKGRCELLDSINARFPQMRSAKRTKDLFGSSPPTLFVGRYGYPSVDVGPMLSQDPIPAAWRLNTPEFWYGKTIDDIISLRTELVRSRNRVNVTRPKGSVLETSQELAMASRAVDTEVTFEKELVLQPALVVDAFSPPRGPMVWIKRAELTENPRIPRKVESVVGDTDVKAVDGARELYQASISPYHLQRLLSAGLLGQKKRRRLVPTRWSITAMDDVIGKDLIKNVKEFQELGEVLLYQENYIGNHFHIILLPRPWSYEMVETWVQGAFWAARTASFHDHESFKGRKNYASRITGAYYAARLSILEHLLKLHRQCTVIVYREITQEYIAPLGVWVIRETVRKAMEKSPKKCDSLEDALGHINKGVKKRNWSDFSVLLKEVRTQRRLEDFLGPHLSPHAP